MVTGRILVFSFELYSREAGWSKEVWGHTWDGLATGSIYRPEAAQPPERGEGVRESRGVGVETWEMGRLSQSGGREGRQVAGLPPIVSDPEGSTFLPCWPTEPRNPAAS